MKRANKQKHEKGQQERQTDKWGYYSDRINLLYIIMSGLLLVGLLMGLMRVVLNDA